MVDPSLQGYPQSYAHIIKDSSESDQATNTANQIISPLPCLTRRKDSVQLGASEALTPHLGSEFNSHVGDSRKYSLYVQNQLQPKQQQHQQQQTQQQQISQVSVPLYEYGGPLRAPSFTTTSHRLSNVQTSTNPKNILLNPPTLLPSVLPPSNAPAGSDISKISGGSLSVTLPEGQFSSEGHSQSYQNTDPLYAHKRGDSGNSVESRIGDVQDIDFWTPNTTFSFPPKSPLDYQLSPTILSMEQHKKDRNDKVSKQYHLESAKRYLSKKPSYRDPFTERSISTEEAEHLDFSLHILKGLMGFEASAHSIERFLYFIRQNESLKRFIEYEKQKQSIGVLDSNNYSIDELCKYLKSFPKSELEALRDVLQSGRLIVEDWITIIEKSDKWSSTGPHQTVNTGDYPINFDFDDTLIHSETSAMRTSVGDKPFSHPGESISLQVEPLKTSNYATVNSVHYYPRGKLQPELSFKVRTTCSQCGSEKTPEWRKGPESVPTLCNACGLFYNKLIKKYGAFEAESELGRRKRDGEPNNRKLYLQSDM